MKAQISTYVISTLFLILGLIVLDDYVHITARVFAGIVIALTHLLVLYSTANSSYQTMIQERAELITNAKNEKLKTFTMIQETCTHEWVETNYAHDFKICRHCAKINYDKGE